MLGKESDMQTESRITVTDPTTVLDVVAWCESTDDLGVWWLRTEPSIYPPPQPLTGVSTTITAEDLVELVQRAVEQRQGVAHGHAIRVASVEIRGHLALEDHKGRESATWTGDLSPGTDASWTMASASASWSIPVLTRDDCERQLPDGIDPLVREIHLARTAPDRHESRIRATKLALYRAATGHDVPGTRRASVLQWVRDGASDSDPLVSLSETQRSIAGALAAMDVHGIGGPGGLGGPEGGTARMSWATDLGKGRRHASDGSAWMSALGAVDLPASTSEDLARAAAILGDDDAAFAIAYAMHRAYEWRHDTEESSRWCTAARAIAAQIDVADSDGGRLAQRYGLEIRRAS